MCYEVVWGGLVCFGVFPWSGIEAYKCSFFPQTIRDWNDLPDSLFSTAEMSDDCVSKFASLVRSSIMETSPYESCPRFAPYI